MAPLSRRGLLLAGAGLCLAGPARAQAVDTLWPLILETRTARLANDAPRWHAAGRRVLALSPEHPDFLISVARAAAALGRAEEANALLDDATRRGAGFEPARFPELAAISIAPEIEARAHSNLQPFARAALFATLPRDCEGIAYDAGARRFFGGTDEGLILTIDQAGQTNEFARGLRWVLGMKVDVTRARLWAVDGMFPNLMAPAENADAGYSALRAFDLATGRELGRWELDERPRMHGLNDLALASDGAIYVSDTAANAIYRLDAEERAFELFFEGATLTAPNGLVLSEDERTLYVAHVEGISAIELASRSAVRLSVPRDAAVNSIDGLARDGGDLIAVQGSPYLERVIRIGIEGGAVQRVETLNSRTLPGYAYTTCAIAQGSVYITGGFPAPNPYGAAPAVEPRPHIARIALS